MTTLKNKRKLATAARGSQEEHSRNSQSQDTPIPQYSNDYITQVTEKIEDRVKKFVSDVHLEKKGNSGRNLQVRGNSSESTSPGTIRNCSGNIPELLHRKPETR